ncbi:hypothetical protein GCM10009731_62150 [Streptomyces globosus]
MLGQGLLNDTGHQPITGRGGLALSGRGPSGGALWAGPVLAGCTRSGSHLDRLPQKPTGTPGGLGLGAMLLRVVPAPGCFNCLHQGEQKAERGGRVVAAHGRRGLREELVGFTVERARLALQHSVAWGSGRPLELVCRVLDLGSHKPGGHDRRDHDQVAECSHLSGPVMQSSGTELCGG